MSWFSKQVTDGLVDTAKGVADVVDKFVETPDEKAALQTVMARMAQEPGLAQVQLQKVSAGHRSVFVAGARPFILWVCGLGLAYAFLINPTIQWITGEPGPVMPLDTILELILGMLGLAGLRTVEKMTGVAK